MKILVSITRWCIIWGAKLLTGLRSLWEDSKPSSAKTVYFANHTSHGDFVLLWASLPPRLRQTTRPVAGKDYWERSALTRFIGKDVFNALMIQRAQKTSETDTDPITQMCAALASGDSLILFPEGTRNTTDQTLLPFKSGIFHLAQSFPEVRFVPVWIENLQKVLPKGTLIPIPLACTVRFGAPLVFDATMDKTTFLQLAHHALLALQPKYQGNEILEPPTPSETNSLKG